MTVILWPYNSSTKGMIMEDAINSQKDVMFYNSSGNFELIQAGNQIIFPSFDEFREHVKKEDVHLLCASSDHCKKIERSLKKHKIRAVTKRESFLF
tara:strand:- start:575 stop:862 length:288 start_codon:yes stop_codon:yes gene_type:complete